MTGDIWLDVTTILNWPRPVVGIVRVEAECARYFLKADSPKIWFCRFDTANKQYFQVSGSEVRQALDRIREPVPVTASGEHRLKKLARHVLRFLPGVLRSKVVAFGSKRLRGFAALAKVYDEFRVALSMVFSPSSPTQTARINATSISGTSIPPFRSKDVYISLGLDWDQKDLEYLYTQKRKIGFRVMLICYDIIPIKFPQLYFGDVGAFFARYFANLAWCADEVLCISECTRKDLTELLTEIGAPIPPMSIITLGCEIAVSEHKEPSLDVQQLIGEKFIMYVSTIERRRNHEVLYRAYMRLIERGLTICPF